MVSGETRISSRQPMGCTMAKELLRSPKVIVNWLFGIFAVSFFVGFIGTLISLATGKLITGTLTSR